MAYALQRIEDGKYVARAGKKSSYTKNIEDARAFDTEQDARRDQCGNERIVRIEYIGSFRVVGVL